ncbi:MAG TPA: YdcF family protein, partial [Rhizobiaceae bacterium]|nr:YdcF family protein [Rhizobiaceae bacterium]
MSIDVRAHDHIPVRSGLRLRKRARAFSLVGAAGLASVTVAAIFAIGFLSFASDVSAMRQPAAAPKADAIIVLTGGHARIDAAVDLLAAGNARRLLISGVHPDTSLESIRRATGG